MTPDDLPDLVRWVAGELWVAGHTDCTWWFVPWVEAATGQSVPCIRPRTDREALRMARDAGGLVALYDRVLGGMGVARAQDMVRAGDVAVVLVVEQIGQRRRPRHLGALRVNKVWVVRRGDGITAGPFRPLAVWRVPWERR